MKKALAIVLSMGLALSAVACGSSNSGNSKSSAEDVKSEGVMTYAEYDAAELESEVVVETYVQAKQSWWEDKATLYTQDHDGGYFIYELPISQDDYDKLTPGSKIKVTGTKSEWSGETEIIDATYEIAEGNYVADPVDCTDLIGKDELIKKQNQLVSFNGLTVDAVSYKNEQPGDDIYVTLSKDGTKLECCLEYYLNGSDEQFYNLVGGLEPGQTVDIEGFLYWYEGANPHLTKVTVK